jgi:hypothetical protein
VDLFFPNFCDLIRINGNIFADLQKFLPTSLFQFALEQPTGFIQVANSVFPEKTSADGGVAP